MPSLRLESIPNHLKVKIITKTHIFSFIDLTRTCSLFFELCFSLKNAITLDNKFQFRLKSTKASSSSNNQPSESDNCISFYAKELLPDDYRIIYKERRFPCLSIEKYEKWKGSLLPFKHFYREIFISEITHLKVLIKIAKELQIRCETCWFTTKVYQSNLEDIGELFQIVQPFKVSMHNAKTNREDLPPSFFDKISSLTLGSLHDYNDKDLLLFKQKYLTIAAAEISSKGINQLLKEWVHGERTIKKITIHSLLDYDPIEIVADIPGVNLLYNLVEHENSILSKLNKHLLGDRIRNSFCYVLLRPENIYQQFAIRIENATVEILEIKNPVNSLLSYLNKEEYFELNGEEKPDYCRLCYEVPCNCEE